MSAQPFDCMGFSVIFSKLKKVHHIFLLVVTLFELNVFCALTQQITFLASNKQSQILCFAKKGQLQPRFLVRPPLLF